MRQIGATIIDMDRKLTLQITRRAFVIVMAAWLSYFYFQQEGLWQTLGLITSVVLLAQISELCLILEAAPPYKL